MRYRRVLVRNFRGITESEIAFSDGVTVVVGDNEAGKSSLREAIGLLRRFKDSSRAAAVKDVAPIGRDAAPFVELEMETGPCDVTYRKQWLRRPFTELEIRGHGGSPRHFTGEEAHAQFEALLQSTTDVNLLDQMNVGQGESLEQATLAEVNALQQALGEAAVQTGSDALMDRLEAEYRTYFTPGGRPTGALRSLTVRKDEVGAELLAARQRYEEADSFIRELEENATELAQLRAKLDQDREDLRALRTRESEVAAQKASLVDRRRELAAKGGVRENLLGERQRRRELEKEARLVAELLGAASVDLTEKKADRVALTDKAKTAAVAAEVADKQWNEAREAHEQALRRANQLRREGELAEAVRRRQRLEAAENALREAEVAAAESPITDEVMQEIDEAARAVDLAEVAWRAGAPTVTVTVLGEAEVAIVGAQSGPVDRGIPKTYEVFGTLSVEAPGVVSVNVDAGSSPEKLEGNVTAARATLQALLDRVGLQDPSQARSGNTVFRQREAQRVRCQDLRDQLEAEATLQELLAQEAALRAALGSASEEPRDFVAPPEGSDAHVPNREKLEGEAAEAASLERRAAAERDEARSVAANLELQEKLVAQRVSDLEARVQELSSRVEAIEATRQAQDAAVSGEQLESQLDAIGAEIYRLTEEVEDLEVAVEKMHSEELAEHLLSLSQSVESQVARIRVLEDRNLELQALLDDRAGEGLFDRVQDLEAQTGAIEEERLRLVRRATATDLLRRTLQRHKEKAQKQYVQPFTDGVTRLGRMVFGDSFDVEVDSSLRIVSRTLEGVTIPFELLSVGAKEQLSLLGRLVCADLVEEGVGAPVILDDTLGYADPERLAGVNLILNQVGKRAQIVVLTCQAERFGSIGSAETIRLGGGAAN